MLTHLFLTGCSAMIYHSHMRKPGTDRLRYLQEFHSLSAAASGFESDFTPVFSTTISPGLSLLCGASFLVSVSIGQKQKSGPGSVHRAQQDMANAWQKRKQQTKGRQS